MRQRLRTQIELDYASWLESKAWNYFLTVTFREPRRDPIRAHRAVWKALSHYTDKAFLAVEPHQSGDLHIHGITWHGSLHPEDRPSSSAVFRDMFTRFGRSRVDLIRSGADVSDYCSKYVVKGLTDYGIYGTKEAWRW